MEEQLIAFKTAELAKEKGFNELCDYSYEGSVLSKRFKSWRNSEDITEYAVCTQSLLQKWLREKHNIRVLVDFEYIDDSEAAYTYNIIYDLSEGKNRKKDIWDFYEIISSFQSNSGWFEFYEESLEEGLYQALKLIK